jgi:ribonucleotide reductase beta subunit family protein with ferritin-like domain
MSAVAYEWPSKDRDRDLNNAGPSDEPLLTSVQRLTVFPLQYPDVYAMYKKQVASLWLVEEVDLSKDREQFARLTADEQRFVKHILVFFSGADAVVSLHIMERFVQDVKVLEAQNAYIFQSFVETIHGEMYALLIDTFITEEAEKAAIFADMGGIVTVRQKIAWAQKWRLDPDAPFARRLVAFALVEGLFFSGAFCAIYWLKQRNLLPGLTKSNEFIARDEGMHTDFACLLYSKLRSARLDEAEVHAMFRDAVGVEKEFITEAIPCRLIGMNADAMCQYIEYVADDLLDRLGYSAIYRATNPFAFMDLIGLSSRSNFFESRATEYQRADVLDSTKQDNVVFTADF